jgi:hypothetical protein
MRVMRSLLKNRIPEEEEPDSEESDDDHEDDRKSSGRDHSTQSDDVRYTDYSPELLNTHPSGEGGFTTPSFAFPADFEEQERVPVEDVIDRGILSIEDAEQLVAYYIHELASFFPLVVLPPTTTAASLRLSKPVLFLSVLAATSISIDAGLAAVLNREMVRLYSERFFIEGEKSLELVQALLLMIIFYFPPASPLKLQFYQYTHIASTMALEIGLANKRRVRKSDRRNNPHDEFLAEQARAVLGCYHLGSTVAMKTRRPNLLQFNDWMVECLKQLERSPRRTDQHLAIWFELQRITDEAVSSFGLDDTSTTSPLTESRVQAVLRWFDKRMETWKKNTPSEMLTGKSRLFPPSSYLFFPTDIPSPVPLILEYRSTALAMYELGVGEGYRDPDAVKKRYFTLPTLDEGPEHRAPLSAIRIDINMKWMNAAQELLDAVLACSTDTMRRLPNLMYTRFGMAVTSLLKIHFSVRTGALGEVVTPQTVNVGYYLEAVANKLQEASGGGKFKIPSRWYQVIGVRGRDWYERLERRNEGVASPESMAQAAGQQSASQSQSRSQSQSQGQGQSQDTLEVTQAMDAFPVPVPMGIDVREGYVAMSGAGMWMDSHGQSHHPNPPFFMGYQQPASHPVTLPSQFAYEPQTQRMPLPGSGTGMELDGWLPDGSIFGMPPLPEF